LGLTGLEIEGGSVEPTAEIDGKASQIIAEPLLEWAKQATLASNRGVVMGLQMDPPRCVSSPFALLCSSPNLFSLISCHPSEVASFHENFGHLGLSDLGVAASADGLHVFVLGYAGLLTIGTGSGGTEAGRIYRLTKRYARWYLFVCWGWPGITFSPFCAQIFCVLLGWMPPCVPSKE
jgi:hypothetical protein